MLCDTLGQNVYIFKENETWQLDDGSISGPSTLDQTLNTVKNLDLKTLYMKTLFWYGGRIDVFSAVWWWKENLFSHALAFKLTPRYYNRLNL